ncbi:MAG: M28 family peptidase [Melioribacteraceae bacterium]|nr:M28 family peptidase [Melioribacteraceae bacterium]
MKKLFLFLLAFAIVSIAQDTSTNPDITIDELRDHLKYLASDELEGRLAGSEGGKLAAEYIKQQFEYAGLLPFYDGSFFQNFEFVQNIELGSNNSASISFSENKLELRIDENFTVAPFSGNNTIEAKLAFTGYGISSSKLEYDDFAGLDLTGRIAIIMRYNPDNDSAMSEFDRFSSLRVKASAARDAGALGVIFVNGYKPNEDDDLIEFKYDRGPAMNDFPIIHVRRTIIDDLLKSEGYDLNELQKQIDETKKPNSFLLNNSTASISTDVKEIIVNGDNVAGYLEGNDPNLKDEYIVIGAHFDHLGWGVDGSMYRGDEPMIHNGADDNASGTSGLLEIAEKLAANKENLKRSIVFMGFNAEELGLLGSAHTVNNFPVDLQNTVAMLNMDMIGRLSDDKALTIIGTGTSSVWKDMLETNNTMEFQLKFNDDGWGGSDHQSFTLKEIPVLFFFTGIHEDYHKPSDDWDKINLEGQKKVADYVYTVTTKIDELDERPDFIKVERTAPKGGGATKVYVGTIPEFGWNGEGFKLGGVSEGGPAQKAGLQGGDIMIQFGEKKVVNIYDFMYAMNEHKPGDVVKVIVLRNDEEMEFDITLEGK